MSSRRTTRLALSTTIGCAALSAGSSFSATTRSARGIAPCQAKVGNAGIPALSRTSLVVPNSVVFTDTYINDYLYGISTASPKDRRKMSEGGSSRPSPVARSSLVSKVSSAGRKQASTELFYRNGGDDDFSQRRPVRVEAIETVDAGSTTGSVRFFSWCVGVVGSFRDEEPQADDFDRYLQFLDHRYHRLHDDDICYDDRTPIASSQEEAHTQNEDALEALGLRELVKRRARRIRNKFDSSSGSLTKSGDGNEAQDAEVVQRETSVPRLCMAAMMSPICMKSELLPAGLSVIKRLQLHHSALVVAQRNLIRSYISSASAMSVSFLALLTKTLRWDVLRNFRTSAAFAAAFALLLYKPIVMAAAAFSKHNV